MSGIDYFQRLTEVITLENKPLLLAAVISKFVGFLQYIYVVRLTLREGKNPMPFWMHSFYLAHDSTWSYILRKTAPLYDDHWFMTSTSTSLLVWSMLEAWTIYKAVFTEREANFATILGKNPAVSAALTYTVAHLMSMYAVVLLLIELFPKGGILQWFCLTNVLIALGPLHYYLRAGSRQGLSLGYCLVCIFGTCFTFAPFGLFVQALPDVFDTTVFYAVGAILSVYCVGCFYVVAQYPPKTRAMTKDGRAPIW